MSGTSKWPMSELKSVLRRAHRAHLAVERPRVGRIVGLAAEVEARREAVEEVLPGLDPAPRVVVEVRDAADAISVVVEPLPAPHQLRHRLAPVLRGQLQHAGTIEVA